MNIKKTIFIIIVFCIFILNACQPQSTTPPSENNTDTDLAEKGELMDYNTYNLNTYLKPLWNTREVYNETVLFVGENDEAPLIYGKTAKILSVTNYGLNITYQENIDYTFSNGKIKRTENSNIPFFTIDEYYKKAPDTIEIKVNHSKLNYNFDSQRYLKYGEKDTFTSKQIAITYTHDSPWSGYKPIGQSDKLPRTINLLKSKQNTSLLFYGDSITAGCNSSGTEKGGNIAPYADQYSIMIKKYLENKFDTEINYYNNSIEGLSSTTALQSFSNNVLNTQSDLAILAFGMNDGSFSVDDYKNNIMQMIDNIHLSQPNIEILLVGTFLPNPESNWYLNQEHYITALQELSEDYKFVACANVTDTFKHLLSTGKRYQDITANNINHPNDFVARLYAQVLLQTILGDDFTINN